jgi:uncharacterized protein (DUF305 family)
MATAGVYGMAPLRATRANHQENDMRRSIFPAILVLGLAAGYALAQHAGHGGHGAPAAASASTQAYQAINAKMHKSMDIRFTGDADVDFVRGMIPHHEGAVEMAKVVLQHGTDAEIRKLAEDVVKAQETEIRQMRDWLKKRGL